MASPPFKQNKKKREQDRVANNLERMGIGKSMGRGIGDGKPSTVLKAKKKGHEGVATNLKINRSGWPPTQLRAHGHG